MENFSYHVPFYVVTGGIDLAGHSADLGKGQVGLFDRNTFSVATSAGNGKEFFFAQGSIGGFDWYGQPVTESHKSPYFFGKDVTNMYLSYPQTIQNEEWVIGFNGSPSSKGLSYVKGQPVRIKLYFSGNPTYRFFGGPKEYTISYTPPVDCGDPCNADDCPDGIADCLVHTMRVINQINTSTELYKFGVQAKLVTTPYTAGTENMEKYNLCLCDNGEALDLHAVQNQFPDSTITRISRTGSTSCYQLCQPIANAAPVDFTRTGDVLLAVCNDCGSVPGSTLTAAQDVYIINTAVPDQTNLTTDAARDTFANSVGTTYGATGANSTFIGQNGPSAATVKIKVAQGTVVAVSGEDILTFSHTEPAVCTTATPTPIAWTLDPDGGISSSRTLRINGLNRPDCNASGDRIADLTAILAGVEGINIGSLTKIAGVGCADDYTVTQNSIDCLPEDCLTHNVTFNYDEVPAFENHAWEVVEPVYTEDATRKCGIRITAGYYDPKFGNCTFDPTDYYETMPVKMEVSLLQEDGDNCDFALLPSQQQTKVGRISRQSGEWVVREVVMKTEAYMKHMAQFSTDARMREAFDMNLLGMVDRKAFYNLYYVSFPASYGKYTFRKNEIQEDFTAVFAFKVGDAAAKVFETNVLDVITAKSGVSLHINQ